MHDLSGYDYTYFSSEVSQPFSIQFWTLLIKKLLRPVFKNSSYNGCNGLEKICNIFYDSVP